MSEDRGSTDKGWVGHERRDVSFRPLVYAGIGLVIVLVLTVFGMERLFDYLAARAARRSEPASPLAPAGRQLPPEPRLQTEPIQDLAALRAREEATLGSYGWVDRQAGIVRIPITRAMELLAERAARDKAQTKLPADPERPLPTGEAQGEGE
jgi:hypothetical protein